MTIMSTLGDDDKEKAPVEEDLEDGEIEDDEEEPPVVAAAAVPTPAPKEEPSSKKDSGVAAKKVNLKRSLESDEEKQRILKEKLKMLERQMAGESYFEDDDDPEEDSEDEYSHEESGDDEEMGVYTAGGSPKRFKYEEGLSEGHPKGVHPGRDRRPPQRPPRNNHLAKGALSKRGRPNPANPRGRNPRKKKSDEICKLFMQGKCQKTAENCLYSHDAVPPKMMELCKFYLFERCAKRDKCLYLHKEFPCKYFHTGNKCVDSVKDCKFSHEPLSDDTRGILLKHLESAPKEILGEFPRLTRDIAASVVFNIEAKNKGWLEDPSQKDSDNEEPPGDEASGNVSMDTDDGKGDSDAKDDLKRKKKSRWETEAENAANVSTGESKQNHFSAVPFPTNYSGEVPPGYGCPNFSEKLKSSEVQDFLKEQREGKFKAEQEFQDEKDDIEIKQTPVPASLPGKRSNQGFAQFKGGNNFQGRNFNNFNNGSGFMGKSNFNGPPNQNFNGPNFHGPPNQGGGFNGPPNQNFHGPPNQGGFNGPPNQVGFNTNQGGFNGPPNQGGFNGPPNQGGFNGPPNQGGFNGPPNQGGFNGPPNQGGFNGPPNQGGFNGPPNQGGFNGPPNQGGFNGPSNQSFNGPPNNSNNYNQNFNNNGFNNGNNNSSNYNGPPGSSNNNANFTPRSHSNFNGPRFSGEFRGGGNRGGRFNTRGNFRGGRGGRGGNNPNNFNNSQRGGGHYFGGPPPNGSGWNSNNNGWNNNSNYNQYGEEDSFGYNRGVNEEEDYYPGPDPSSSVGNEPPPEEAASEAPKEEILEGPSSPPPPAPKANRDPRARRDPRRKDSPSSAPDEAEKERRILDLDISAFGDLEIPSLHNEEDEDALPFKGSGAVLPEQSLVSKEIDASILSRPPIDYSLVPLALEKPDYTDIIQKHHIPSSQITQDPRLRRYSDKVSSSATASSSLVKTKPEADSDVYNPKRDLIQQQKYPPPNNVTASSTEGGAYSPSQDVQDMYGQRQGGLYKGPQEDVYNPRKDLSGGNDYGGYPQNFNKPGSNRNDPRMSRRDPRRRD